MTKKKILYIITQGGIWGGAQRYIYDLTTNLANDYDITIAIGEPKGKKDLQERLETENLKLKTVQLKHLVRKISPIKDFLAIFELRKLYKKIKPDIIHLNSSKTSILGSLAHPPSPIPHSTIVYTVHGWVFNEPLSKLKKKLYFLLEKYTAKFKDKIIVLNKKEYGDAVERLKIPAKKLSIIHQGVEMPQNQLGKIEARKKLNKLLFKPILDNSYYIVGTIANHYKTKGLDVLIKAAVKLKEKNIHFVIIGNGPEKNNLQLQITNYKLQNFYLLGFIDNANKYLPALDLFVLPSRKEGFPYTILEAMSQNIPIIATDVGGIPTLVQNKKTGSLIKPDNADELAKIIFETYTDQEQTKIFAKQALSETQKYTLKNTLDKTKLLYHQLLQLK